MKLLLLLLLAVPLFAQDTVKTKSQEYLKELLKYQRDYMIVDSVQMKRKGIIEYLQMKYTEALKEEQKKKK